MKPLVSTLGFGIVSPYLTTEKKVGRIVSEGYENTRYSTTRYWNIQHRGKRVTHRTNEICDMMIL
jgi:hypothetical protein